MCAWASLDEEDGQYIVEDVKNPYELYAFFLDNLVELMLVSELKYLPNM